jgi:exonuclease SbcC
MINKMTLENFQSWPLTTFNFHKGVNVITGVSDSGKTAILRAYRAFAENKPGGTAYVSDWIKTKGGGIKKGQICAVTIEKENGTATRFRNEANGYSVNGKVLEAIGTGVPEEATKFLNMDEVNLQKQMDPPFLLGATPGEVSRFFNKMIKLESIDKCLSLAKKRKLETSTALNINKAAIEEIEADIENLSNLEELEE